MVVSTRLPLVDESNERRPCVDYIVDQQAQMYKAKNSENSPNPLSIFRTTARWIAARCKVVVQWLLVVPRMDNAEVVIAGWTI